MIVDTVSSSYYLKWMLIQSIHLITFLIDSYLESR